MFVQLFKADELAIKMESVEFYEENCNRDTIHSWLDLERVFKNIGRQGVVGILAKSDHRFCFKYSKFLDYSSENESVVCSQLQEWVTPYCPHFVWYYGSILTSIYESNEITPFAPRLGHMGVPKLTLFFKFMDRTRSFYSHITKKTKVDMYVFNVIKQVILALKIAQDQIGFTHYDLHPGNIMLTRCHKHQVFLYVLDEDTHFAVATKGYCPVIIDYGNSYCTQAHYNPFWSNMFQTHMGITSYRYDWLTDFRVFLLNSSSLLNLTFKGRQKKIRRFRQLIKNIFTSPEIDLDSGWEEEGNRDKDSNSRDSNSRDKSRDRGYYREEYSGLDKLNHLLESKKYNQTVYGRKTNFFLEILQPLCWNPLSQTDQLQTEVASRNRLHLERYSNICEVFEKFMEEWLKIEIQIQQDYFNMLLLRELVLGALELRVDYTDLYTRPKAVSEWERYLCQSCYKIAPFVNPTGINAERLLCSMFLMGNCMKGVFHDTIYLQDLKRKKRDRKLPIKSVEELYSAIETNGPCDYVYGSKTYVRVVDPSGLCDIGEFTLTKEETTEINGLHPLCRGTFLYKIAQNRKNN